MVRVEPSSEWRAANQAERGYWSLPNSAAHEGKKQRAYAALMGIRLPDMNGKNILDIGGGPASILLQCTGYGNAAILDPIPLTVEEHRRYVNRGIRWIGEHAERWEPSRCFDEVWISNVLQHVEDPAEVLRRAQRAGRLLRLFEWLEVPTDRFHLHRLSRAAVLPYLDFAVFGERDDGLLSGQYIAGVWIQ